MAVRIRAGAERKWDNNYFVILLTARLLGRSVKLMMKFRPTATRSLGEVAMAATPINITFTSHNDKKKTKIIEILRIIVFCNIIARPSRW